MQSERLWSKRFVHLLCIEALFQFGLFMVNPILSNYAVALGASIALGGTLAGLHAAASFAMRPITGIFADRFSKKSMLIAAALLFMVSSFGSALVQEPYLLGLFRIIQGIAFAFRSFIVVSMVSLVTPENMVGAGVGWLGLASTLATAISPAIGSTIGSLFGYPMSFILSGTLFSVGLILSILFKAPRDSSASRGSDASDSKTRKKEKGDSPRRAFRLRSVICIPAMPLSLVAGLSMLPQAVAVTLLYLVGEQNGIEGMSVYFMVFAFAALAAKPFSGRMADKYGLAAVVVPMLVVEAIGMTLLAIMSSPAMIAIAGFCMGVGQASVYSATQAETVRYATVDDVGKAANTFFIGPDLSVLMGPLLGGFILQSFGSTILFSMCVASTCVALACYLLLEYKRRKRKGKLVEG